MNKQKIIKKSVFFLVISLCTLSTSATIASTLSIFCPTKYSGYHFAAAYSNNARWKQGVPPLISCDYGLKKEGSYHFYYPLYLKIAEKNVHSLWEKEGVMAGMKCITSNPIHCPMIPFSRY